MVNAGERGTASGTAGRRARVTLGIILLALGLLGVWNLFPRPDAGPATGLRAITNILWPTFLIGAALLLRRPAETPTSRNARTLLVVGLCLVAVGFGPMLVLQVAPSLDNESTGMTSTILALLLGLPGFLLSVVGLVRLKRLRRGWQDAA